ncbi:lysylphosphatidylglycerol synthase transmembrane domain-containing protein [Pseudonocardia halophobica]|uniref:lysylphosphatidylglycerol synthase transmembrane domain-containing protein n=1 Tax=Pseudonocardia halophobica TaxID=29401 RepID=UPI003D8C58D9
MAAPRLRSALTWPLRHLKTVLHWILVAAALGYIAWQLPEMARAVREADEPLSHLRPGWLGLAVALAVAALMLYGELHRLMLVIGGARVSGRTVQAITFAENAIANTVPVVGGAGALAYSIARLRSRGVDAALASWSVFLPGALSTIVLLVGAVFIVSAAGWMPMWLALMVAAAIAVGTMGFWSVLTHASVLHRILLGLVHLWRRVPGVCHDCRGGWASDPEATANRLTERINILHPTPWQWLLLTGTALASWAADFLALHACATALGLDARWTTLALGFLVVQLSIALQVLPGGAGLAETGLLGVLLASGAPAAPAAATVLVYRLITWLGLSVAGWIVYAAQIHLTPPHWHRHRAADGTSDGERELPPGTVPST